MKKVSWKGAAEYLKKGRIGIVPTDTLYGISVRAFSEELIREVYRIKERDLSKPFIFLIGSLKDLYKFNVDLSEEKKKILNKFWPGNVSIILPCLDNDLEYLHRGSHGLAFRMPRKKKLLELLIETGPIVSTSVNPEGKDPARSISEAREYFKEEELDFYIDEGKISGKASTILDFTGSTVRVIRRGGWQWRDHLSLDRWKKMWRRLIS